MFYLLFRKKSTRELVQGGSTANMPSAEKSSPKKCTTRIIASSRMVLGIACILIAAIIAFVVLPQLYEKKNELTNVVTLTQSVEAGTVITGDILAEAQVNAYRMPQGFVRSKDEAIGKVAMEPLYGGEYLWSARLADAASYQEYIDEQTKGLKDGYCLVTIELPSTSTGVAGVLRAGDSVDIFEFIEDPETETYSVELRMPEMYVYDVLNKDLVSLSTLDEMLDEGNGSTNVSTGDRAPVYAIFRCLESQVQELIRMEKQKALHMVLK